jgi:hypothetical protein
MCCCICLFSSSSGSQTCMRHGSFGGSVLDCGAPRDRDRRRSAACTPRRSSCRPVYRRCQPRPCVRRRRRCTPAGCACCCSIGAVALRL